MITLTCSFRDGVYFEGETGLSVQQFVEFYYPDAQLVELGLSSTIYEAGDKLPELPPVVEVKEVSIETRFEQLAARVKVLDGKEEEKLAYVEGDNPNTPEIEKGWWTSVLEFVGIK